MEIQEGGNQKKKTTTENKIKTPRRGCVKSKKLSVRKGLNSNCVHTSRRKKNANIKSMTLIFILAS